VTSHIGHTKLDVEVVQIYSVYMARKITRQEEVAEDKATF
jgi:hypothetical protein